MCDIYYCHYEYQRQYYNSPSIADEIKKLGKLKLDGLLTKEEFETKKSQLLNSDDDLELY